MQPTWPSKEAQNVAFIGYLIEPTGVPNYRLENGARGELSSYMTFMKFEVMDPEFLIFIFYITGYLRLCQDHGQTEGTHPSDTHSPSSLWEPSALMFIIPGRAFVMMKTRFRAIFLPALEVHHTFVPHVITACAILHNICLGVGDLMTPEDEGEMQ